MSRSWICHFLVFACICLLSINSMFLFVGIAELHFLAHLENLPARSFVALYLNFWGVLCPVQMTQPVRECLIMLARNPVWRSEQSCTYSSDFRDGQDSPVLGIGWSGFRVWWWVRDILVHCLMLFIHFLPLQNEALISEPRTSMSVLSRMADQHDKICHHLSLLLELQVRMMVAMFKSISDWTGTFVPV